MRISQNHIRGVHRLLIRSTNWIGDAVMTTPAVRAVRRNFPAARITLLAKPWVAPIFAHSPDIDEVLIYRAPGRDGGAFGPVRVARRLRRRRFDAAILLQNAFEAALISFLAGTPLRIGYDRDARGLLLTHAVPCPPVIRRGHQIDYYLNLLAAVGLGIDGKEPRITVSPQAVLRASRRLSQHRRHAADRLVGINPSAAYGPAKQWHPRRFARLADQLQDRSCCGILIFGGPDDRALGDAISRMARRPVINLAGKTDLQEAMALIAACRVFVTNDSGLMHVAAALRVPLVAIFGSTNPAATGPTGPNSRVVRSRLPCSPCLKTHCPLGHYDCMAAIEVEQVCRAVEDLL
jgi:heptosyltransferase-2